ncbi:MAG TPA: DUF4338 domain-containing protein, partial [Caldilineaceae bacterium]|nr:DUF4338 domain-containing protein [Caldilineaceae bacterium]
MTVAPIDYIPFRPALTGPFAKRFYQKAERLLEGQFDQEQVDNLISEEVTWATSSVINPRQRRIYRAVWLFLRDLIRVGWHGRWLAGTLELAPPTEQEKPESEEDIAQAKGIVREAMKAPRLEKLLEAKDFIRRMETPNGQGITIRSLLADGKVLAHDLQAVASIEDREKRTQALHQIVQPYMQLVEENERCLHTGYKLSDIWRYFRLTWATPAESTPGRTMLYLVRDGARPYHPIMGIASLENAPLHIAARDDYLGWSLAAFMQKVSAAMSASAVRTEFSRLERYIETAIDELDISELCSAEECQNPTPATFQRLRNIATQSAKKREVALDAWQVRRMEEDFDAEDLAAERSRLGNISLEAEEALYRRKRAERLEQLLSARQELRKLPHSENFDKKWQEFLATQSGQATIRNILRMQKNRHVGTSILELNTCGAVPPYNEVLAGKLTALLMLSPQVVADYKRRYGERPSDIASRMQGKDVIRPAEIVFLGTTSLYKTGASQYNRLKLPSGLLKRDGSEVRWEQLGETGGYGTLHIHRLTLKALEEAATSSGATYVNHIFGEGASPKLRALRHSLGTILESEQRSPSVEFTQHKMSRLVYGAWLACNGREFLAGETEQPIYYFDPTADPKDGTQRIAEYWIERWLSARIAHSPALERIAAFNPSDLLVSQDLRDVQQVYLPAIAEDGIAMQHNYDSTDLRDLARNLYRGLSAYADKMNDQWLATIHIETRLEEEIVRVVAEGKSVILTGNPGDGKTHLLRLLEPQLSALQNQPVVELDASAVTNAELKTMWEEAEAQGHPFCVAINEAVLKNLADSYSDFQPLQIAQHKVETAIRYAGSDEPTSNVVVFDLSRRNVLSREIVRAAIEKLTNSNLTSQCSMCPREGCDLIYNRELLRKQLVQERLQAILDRISRRGYHATVRELQSLISYLLFGGRTCNQLLQESGNDDKALPQLVFSGEGRLFDLLRMTFDPANVSHPVWDDRLLSADTQSEKWLPEWHERIDALDPNDCHNFRARKRA